EATVEKVAVNAVMAGCPNDVLPIVLAAVEAACVEEFALHGLIATTYPAGPTIVVSGPLAAEVGMNAGGNCLGQGNRANSTIGRALQLVARNVGGARPAGQGRLLLRRGRRALPVGAAERGARSTRGADRRDPDGDRGAAGAR